MATNSDDKAYPSTIRKSPLFVFYLKSNCTHSFLLLYLPRRIRNHHTKRENLKYATKARTQKGEVDESMNKKEQQQQLQKSNKKE